VPDIPERVHWEDELAQNIGIPAAFDYGPQRVSWFGHLLMNYVSDFGWIEYQDVQLREPILIGDTSWLHGNVIRKYVEDGRHLVELQTWPTTSAGARRPRARQSSVSRLVPPDEFDR
jgi:hypothetical protein